MGDTDELATRVEKLRQVIRTDPAAWFALLAAEQQYKDEDPSVFRVAGPGEADPEPGGAGWTPGRRRATHGGQDVAYVGRVGSEQQFGIKLPAHQRVEDTDGGEPEADAVLRERDWLLA